MKCALVLMLAAFANGQDADTAGRADPTLHTDVRLHADVMKLIEVTGVRAAMQNAVGQLVTSGKAKMMQVCPGCSPAFADEWARRMLARINLDDFIAVYARVYEKYLTDDDVVQLIALRNRAGTSQPPAIPDGLKQKLSARMTSIQSEIMGGTTQLGAKLGGDIGREIQQEHPEYFKQTAAGRP